MTIVLFLGFMLGLQHALEADHVAAVASLASRHTSLRRIVRHGWVWGVGHMLTLTAFAGIVLLSGGTVGPHLATWLEFIVGLMLVALGLNVLYRLYRDRVHFHMHWHHDGKTHLHAHSHAEETVPHAQSPHDHTHDSRFPLRSLFIGMMHGVAGSAALVLLAAGSLASPVEGLAYVVVFGVGSVLGMALFSAAIAVPLTASARLLTWTNRGLQTAIGLGSSVIGVTIILDSRSLLFTL
ncbi:MAG: sulfite exporter TauE/SafE family protein [Rubricoccaceae bacterium]|nr:sulfite exporter TauE/SafE family protein [Rubricoccaceae bacterium]